MTEISRRVVDNDDGDSIPLDLECCGKKFTLWWNGGELDEHTCQTCGKKHALEHGEIYYVVSQRSKLWN